MKKFIFYFLLMLSLLSKAQFSETFTDGGFNVNPHWDTLSPVFVVVNQELNIRGFATGGSSAIVTADTLVKSAEWNIYVRLGFEPSDNDNAKIILVSDTKDIRSDFFGYFLKIGKDGNSDGLEFNRKDGNAEFLLKNMLTNQLSSFPDLNLRIIKNNLGKWVFYWKDKNQTSYSVIDSVIEKTYTKSSYFGMVCNYTAASKDSFFFDDISSALLPLLDDDSIPPVVVNAILINRTQIDVLFNEPVEAVSAQQLSNYNLSGIGIPINAILDGSNKQLVHLFFATPVAPNTTYTLATNNIKDTTENLMTDAQEINIQTGYYASAGDVVINELMIKPNSTPPLPNAQYVEIRNNTNETIRLRDWSLNNLPLKDGYILPNGYAILCAVSDTNAFKFIGNTVGVLNWQSLFVNGNISLRTAENILSDTLSYQDNFYQDTIKQQGGWSMELNYTGYEGTCPKNLFWAASKDIRGGTPGIINASGFPAVKTNATFSLVTNNTIEVNFSIPLDKIEAELTGNYMLDNGITVQSVVASGNNSTVAILTLSAELQKNSIYTLIVKEFSGCAGNIHAADTFEIAITDLPIAGDLVLNELLFNPEDGVEQFVEIYNTTNKLFKIKDLILTQADIISGIALQELKLDTVKGYIFPSDYLVFSKNKISIVQKYTVAVLSKFTDVNVPVFDNKEDVIVLKNAQLLEIDKLHYNENWHYPLLFSNRGVSLERSRFNGTTQDKRNWHSASEDVGLATPGYLNSNDTYGFEDGVHIIPEIFSPDGDGFDDEAKITYSFQEAGSVVNVYFYSTDGRLVIHLIKDKSISKDGVFIWDGKDENGNKSNVNIYFMIFERQLPNGKKIIYKRKCGLATQLK